MEIDVELVRRLIAARFPQWTSFPIIAVEPGGWDNRTFRLGSNMAVRLPSAERYVAQVEKEHRWLPFLARSLPFPIPTPIAKCDAAEGYPWPWSVYRWIDGETATVERISDLSGFAADLAGFLVALHGVGASEGPPAGTHNFFRGGLLALYDGETRQALKSLAEAIDQAMAYNIWCDALASRWHKHPVWVHGDMGAGNLLVKDGALNAVIDFGSMGVGDPACDLSVAWTLLSRSSRRLFREHLGIDRDTWSRGRGWVLWKALITLEEHIAGNESKANHAQRVICELIDDYRSE